jgi:hypothetical protein
MSTAGGAPTRSPLSIQAGRLLQPGFSIRIPPRCVHSRCKLSSSTPGCVMFRPAAQSALDAPKLSLGHVDCTVELRSGPPRGPLPRGEALPWHAMGGTWAERSALLGTNMVWHGNVHVRAVPAGISLGGQAAGGPLRPMRRGDNDTGRHRARHSQYLGGLCITGADGIRHHQD